MNREKIADLVGKCIEKAAEDFLAGKPVDHQALRALWNTADCVMRQGQVFPSSNHPIQPGTILPLDHPQDNPNYRTP